MSLKLAQDSTTPYNYFSQGDGSNPLSITITLDGSGGYKDSSTVEAYLVATEFKYTGIEVTVINDDSSRDWKISLDGVDFYDTVNPPDMDARSEDQVTTLYFRVHVLNDGSLSAQEFTTPDVKITATEST